MIVKNIYFYIHLSAYITTIATKRNLYSARRHSVDATFCLSFSTNLCSLVGCIYQHLSTPRHCFEIFLWSQLYHVLALWYDKFKNAKRLQCLYTLQRDVHHYTYASRSDWQIIKPPLFGLEFTILVQILFDTLQSTLRGRYS